MPSTEVPTACSGADFQAQHHEFRSDFATCAWRRGTGPLKGLVRPRGLPSSGPALSPWQDTWVKEPSPKAHLCFLVHSRASTRPLVPSHALPEHEMLFCPFWAAQREPSGCRWQEAISCYRNIRWGTAGQFLMSVALNHKHFELFWYNGKLWEGERTRTG